MSTTRPSVLPAVAALHVLLAQCPDLAEPPCRWSFDPMLYAVLPDEPDSLPLLRRIAEVIGAEVEEGRPGCGSDGVMGTWFTVEGTAHGFRVQSSVRITVELPGGAQ